MIILMLVVIGTACSSKDESALENESVALNSEKEDSASVKGEPILPKVHRGSQTLLFTFVDERGVSQAVSEMDKVPAGVKERVYVTDLSLTPAERQAHRFAFFTDLTQPDSAGFYPVTVVSRYKAAAGEKGPPLAAAPKGSVVVYSAVWCGYCKKAKAWLKKKNIPFIERDVEKMPGAAAELKEKLAKKGISGGGIPVLDVKGTLVVGFDQKRIAQLLSVAP